MTDREPLQSSTLTAPVSEARVDRAWEAVHARLAERPRRRARLRALGAAGALASAALVLTVVTSDWKRPVVSAVDTDALDSMTLPEGSRIASSRGARFALESATRERVAIALESGAINLDVAHVKDRAFTVTAGAHRVSVIGTRFSVAFASGRLDVKVERGRVRIDGPRTTHELAAGESWSGAALDGAQPIESPAAPASEGDHGASEKLVLPPSPSAGVPTDPATGQGQGARELFARGLEARRLGRERAAAAAFDGVRTKFRSDSRAGLAAYELGRIRLDSLGDASGAAEAFADAIGLAPHGHFREDAEARRVDALDTVGDRAKCDEAREAYLNRYPSGLHVRRVSQRCANR